MASRTTLLANRFVIQWQQAGTVHVKLFLWGTNMHKKRMVSNSIKQWHSKSKVMEELRDLHEFAQA